MSEATKNKVLQLYQFLKQANQLRNSPVRELSRQEKVIRFAEIPEHPTAQVLRPVRTSESMQDVPEYLLRVRRPNETTCPPPPEHVLEWLLPGWDDPRTDPVVAQSRNMVTQKNFKDDQRRVDDLKTYQELRANSSAQLPQPPVSISTWLREGWDDPTRTPEVFENLQITETINFGDDHQLVASFEEWMQERTAWTVPELAARNAMAFYERIYDLYVTLEKDGEKFELLVADGRFQWQANSELSGQVLIDHPILLKRVELHFFPEVPEFVVAETDRESELYSSLFVDLKDLMPAAIRNRHKDLTQTGYHPLGWDDTTGFLRAVIQTISPTKGEFLEESPSTEITTTPRLFRDPSLLLRRRNTGLANAFDAIIESIEKQQFFPAALELITGTSIPPNIEDLSDGHGSSRRSPASVTIDDDILLAKQANEEQLQIIRRLNHSGSVIVQGPPGTGKTHTIGNLIGHLLAQGKSILVTAQTTKALRVVRDKVPEILRPLAVSVLGSDQSAKNQLESAIGSITERMTSDSAESLLKKAEAYAVQRRELLQKKNELKQKLRCALENEYREIYVGSTSFTPSQAARYILEHRQQHGWIPAPVKVGADLTVNVQELSRLYSLSQHFTAQEEVDAYHPLPELASLPNAQQFRTMVSEYQGLVTADLSIGADRWNGRQLGNSETLAAITAELTTEFSDELRRQTWRPHAIVASIHGGTSRLVWESLIQQIQAAAEAQAQLTLLLHHQPKLSETLPLPTQKKVIVEICTHLSSGGKLGFLQMLTKSEWKQFIKGASVSAGEPNHKDHFEALHALVHLEQARQALGPLWNQLIGNYISRSFERLGPQPEQACRALIPEIRRCLDWHEKIWLPIENNLHAEGLKFDEVMALIPREASPVSEYQVIETLTTSVLPAVIAAEVGRRKLAESEAGFVTIEQLANSSESGTANAGCTGRIVSALRSRDSQAYEQALTYARKLHAIKPLIDERKALLTRLALVAPVWAEQIANRTEPHHRDAPPGDISPAWTWCQLNANLIERDALSADDIQLEINKVETTLRKITLWLIDARAWGKQLERLKQNNSRQSLVGWLDTMKALASTRQQDRRQALLSEARKLMKQSAGVVPVWVMPISIVAESFDPRTTRFDVVIIDEASQADLNALIPLYLGKQVIIVGDHEQVTPLGVGQGQVLLNNLRQQCLREIPNSHLFDSKFSIYDIGRQSFGDGIRLVEHFRCVPEIIAFSNQLSYEGKIRPLRESNSTDIKPACVSIKVNGCRENDVNRAEARRIIDLIKAMISHPRYAGKSIGVISMIGDEQTNLIETMIFKEIPSTEIDSRRIIAGNSSEFQGDERDIILLSMVDSPDKEGPMRLTGAGAFDLNKKRYNVAVSRARDQLLVVHSFDKDLHLKPGDLRLQLLQHVADPLASLRAYHQAAGKTESPFERAVLKILTDAGFKIRSQWEVGYYRIDLVVEGGGKRLAIECDGDRYHPIEKLAEDIERQTILERLGWQFVRIRGSAFYRDADAAMRPVFARLDELEIPREADSNLPNTNDMTLLHELDELIEGSTQKVPVQQALQIGREDHPKDEELQDSLSLRPTEKFEKIDQGGGDARMPGDILARMGGVANLDSFLRELARTHGFQRLGKNVRDRMMAEIEASLNNGTLFIKDKKIQLTDMHSP